MTRTLTVVLIVLMALPIVAQAQAEFDEIAQAQALERRAETYRAMGLDSWDALEAAIITTPGLSMQQRMLLLSRLTDDPTLEVLAPALVGQGGGGTGITAHGDALFVAEDGWIYRIDPDTLGVLATGRYRPEQAADAELGADFDPLIDMARVKAESQSCMSNMKQLCLASLMYAQDWDQHLVQGQWPEELYPYLQNRQIFICPSRPELPVAYAFNERLQGAAFGDIPNPAQTVMFFESTIGGDCPTGGVDAVPEEPIHEDFVTVGFADGHVKMMTPEALRDALAPDPFE